MKTHYKLSVRTILLSTCLPLWAANFDAVLQDKHLSDVIEIYKTDKDHTQEVDGEQRSIGGAFQPSAVLDGKGQIHIFFQARLDSSDDHAEKMIAHVVSSDGGQTFSEPEFIYPKPLQNYAMSPFIRNNPDGGERISLLTCISMDETLTIHGNATTVKAELGIDMNRFTRKAAALILEFYSDDFGKTWQRKEHYDVVDRVYPRNGKDFYVAFMNLIGQVRRIEEGPFKGRLILAGPIRGDYLPCEDHEKFRQYQPSSSVIYSDDQGETWTFGGIIADEKTAFEFNEASAVPVNKGERLVMVRRANARKAPGKMIHYSDDGGDSWGPGILSSIEATRCLQVLEKHGDTVMCSTPGHKMRSRGQIYFSRDHGASWTKKQIEDKLFSYSTVQHLQDDHFICVWSRGHHGEIGIAARIFHGDWLGEE